MNKIDRRGGGHGGSKNRSLGLTQIYCYKICTLISHKTMWNIKTKLLALTYEFELFSVQCSLLYTGIFHIVTWFTSFC